MAAEIFLFASSKNGSGLYVLELSFWCNALFLRDTDNLFDDEISSGLLKTIDLLLPLLPRNFLLSVSLKGSLGGEVKLDISSEVSSVEFGLLLSFDR